MSTGEKRAAFPVRLIDIPERQVAYIRVTNAFELDRVLAALKTVIEWAKSQDIFSQGILFGMTVDDPHVTPKHLYRYEVCLASSFPFEWMEGISKLKMPAMRYAAIKVSGDIHKLATAWDYLYRDWLINSVHEPEHAPALEVFLDKENATDWSHFELELCVSVRKLAALRSLNSGSRKPGMIRARLASGQKDLKMPHRSSGVCVSGRRCYGTFWGLDTLDRRSDRASGIRYRARSITDWPTLLLAWRCLWGSGIRSFFF
jgi:DNA gyrase inhibitor GyrI